MKSLFLPAALLFGLSGCASILQGSSQSVMVDTVPTDGMCTLTNDKGLWDVSRTPSAVTVAKAYSPLSVVCWKGKGKDQLVGTQQVQSTTSGMAFGNVLAGGIIGASIDMSSGAAYLYPTTITVTLTKPEE